MNTSKQRMLTQARQTQPALVLVVDDDLGMRRVLEQLLESDNLRVIKASNGLEALELYHSHSPDLILLDAMMPIMDGFTCCQQLCRSRQPCLVPVLMVTTLDDEDSVFRAFEAGATDYVTKPINPSILRQRVQRLIYQSRLMQQVQQMNDSLDDYAQTLNVEIRERTVELQRALELESCLKQITDRVRDSLDEGKILQTIVQELAWALEVGCCNAAIYDLNQQVSYVRYEYTASIAGYQNRVVHMDSYPEIYQQLLQRESVYFCSLPAYDWRGQVSMFAFPIQNGEVLGDIWLVSFADRTLDDLEVRLVQQAINQCAIALRQAKLYQAAQTQVQELERLNQLKDDFLSTVSHELRTPMSNIQMATQMLEVSLQRLGLLSDESNSVSRYFHVLLQEEQREIRLINDLLDLTRLDAETDSLDGTAVDLQFYIPHLVDTFGERMQQQQQQFFLQIPKNLPPLATHFPYLERILSELLHNACKYTPKGETITVSAHAMSDYMQIQVSNSGVEISPLECDRIFDKFYRIPNNDPWKHSGTGLGLALVKKLVERLGATIHAESSNGQTTFILAFKVLR